PNELPPETERSRGDLPRSSADPALPTVVRRVSLGSGEGRMGELPDMERERGLAESGGDAREPEEEEEELKVRGEKRLLKKRRDREGDDTAASSAAAPEDGPGGLRGRRETGVGRGAARLGFLGVKEERSSGGPPLDKEAASAAAAASRALAL
ncbi:hypothetical protein HK405_000482, partial [Cladochytrium tenue]